MSRAPDDTLYQRLLAERGTAALPAPRPPRASAAVVLWRRTGPGVDAGDLEVFWVRRADTLPFMGGWHAFPGGGMSRRDPSVPVEGVPRGLEVPTGLSELPETLLDGVGEPAPDLVPGLTACALRELFEETGVLLVRELLPGAAEGPVASATQLEEARRRLLARELRFGELITELGLTPDASPLVFAGRWLTPPFAPLRFDNRFFLLEWPREASQQPKVDGESATASPATPAELTRGEWVRPGEARERWRRGEVIAAPPILHLLAVLAEDGPEDGLERLRRPREADLGPFRRIEFRPRVVMLPLATATLPPATHTNAYLVGSKELALIDPGTSDPDEQRRMADALDDLERFGQRVVEIWLTHHHPDHVGGVEAARQHLARQHPARERGVPVLAHRESARRLESRGITVDGELTDGEVRELAGPAGSPPVRVRVVHTPGHAPGHLCFLEEDGRSLIAGDLVAGVGTVVIDPPDGDMDAYLASLRRVLELEPETLFPAHGPAIRDARGKLEEYIEHRLWREGKVLEAWTAGLRTAEEMLPEVYDDAPEQAWPLARRQIEAHLERLRGAGEL